MADSLELQTRRNDRRAERTRQQRQPPAPRQELSDTFERGRTRRWPAYMAATAALGVLAVGIDSGAIEFRNPRSETGQLQSPVVVNIEEIRRYWEIITTRQTATESSNGNQQPLASMPLTEEVASKLSTSGDMLCPQPPHPTYFLTNTLNGVSSEPMQVCVDSDKVSVKQDPMAAQSYWLSVPLVINPSQAGFMNWESAVTQMDPAECQQMLENVARFTDAYIDELPIAGITSVDVPIVVTPSLEKGDC